MPPGQDLTILFCLCDAGRGVQQVLNPSILILLIQVRVVGLQMLSKGLNLALLRRNLSVTKLQMAVSEELQAAHNR